ncbi:MAG TPA: hypothetical protein PLI27_06595 [Ignavibacteriales bacterium]|nr:hypothetical protein [Ignavibacteriales bacterium]
MDGDNMGSLIHGVTLGATYKNLFHPLISENIKDNVNEFANFLNEKRLLTISTHTSISEALSDFAIYGVARIIDR